MTVEGTIFAVSVWVYACATRARDRMGQIGLWVYVGTLTALYVGNVVGPPPPDVTVLALFALGIWLLPPWAAWIDRHRASGV